MDYTEIISAIKILSKIIENQNVSNGTRELADLKLQTLINKLP